jgi:hypothetical protein
MDPRDLYGLPLERFIGERNALAKKLRAEGRRDEAARVAAMRKPSLAAWAVNQLVRTQRGDTAALYDAGDRVAKTQTDLVAGRGDPVAFRAAVKRERASVAKLVEAARGLLSAEGHELTPAMLEHVSDTLHAAALDAQARAQVDGGCLQKELRHVGLGEGQAIPTRTTRTSGTGEPPAPRKPASTASERRPARGEREQAKRRNEASRSEAKAHRLAQRADRDLKSAQERRDHAAKALADVEVKLADARVRAEEAEAAYRQAQRAREHL